MNTDASSPQPLSCLDPANQIFFLFGLPKSAGNALRSALDACFLNRTRPEGIPPSLFCPSGLHVELPLVDGVLCDLANGGWYHTHAAASLVTLDFVYRHQVCHIVLVRNPLDQLVAYRCHTIKHARMGMTAPARWRPPLATTIPQAPVPMAAFDQETDPHVAFDLMIHHGYFEACLSWCATWAAFRDERLSCIVSYDLSENPASVLTS